MAKRKRLSPANPGMFGTAPETKSMMSRAPIADVASEAATTAALHDVTRELAQAKAQGRMVLSLPVSAITLDHIVRDRSIADEAEMEALRTSIAGRGQQTPIEVLETEPWQYGLISGWRRGQAIAQLHEQGRHDGTVLALLRQPAEASETYQAMVEENEIRVGLSYYESARIAAKALSITSRGISATLLASPTSAMPAATTISVAVRVSPPKTKACVTRLWPTDCGPMVLPSSDTTLPPPRPTATMSGMRKLVRTPPTSTARLLSRGKPPRSTPISLVVPPISTTIASSRPVTRAAPRSEFVGPDENVSAG